MTTSPLLPAALPTPRRAAQAIDRALGGGYGRRVAVVLGEDRRYGHALARALSDLRVSIG